MEFPIQITFDLEKVRNESWTTSLNQKWDSLIELINKSIDNDYSKDISSSITSLSSKVNYIDSEYNVKEIEFSFAEYRDFTLDIKFPEDNFRDTYYVIIEPNGNSVSISLNGDENPTLPGFNRTLYIIKKLDVSNFLVYKKLEDMYFPEEGEFDSNDFIDWDFPTIYNT